MGELRFQLEQVSYTVLSTITMNFSTDDTSISINASITYNICCNSLITMNFISTMEGSGNSFQFLTHITEFNVIILLLLLLI